MYAMPHLRAQNCGCLQVLKAWRTVWQAPQVERFDVAAGASHNLQSNVEARTMTMNEWMGGVASFGPAVSTKHGIEAAIMVPHHTGPVIRLPVSGLAENARFRVIEGAPHFSICRRPLHQKLHPRFY